MKSPKIKQIKLTQGKIALVDNKDFKRLCHFKWRAKQEYKNCYAVRYSHTINGKDIIVIMHREILNASNGIFVDHKNGNGLDNRRNNLRICTHQQNHYNRKLPHTNNKLGIKGVSWHNRVKKFQAQIQVNKRKIYLGYFNVLGDADSAYRIAEEKYFGEFARNYENKN